MLLRGAYLSFRRRIQAHCAEYGITSDQLVLLSLLAEQDGISQAELAARSYTDPATLTAMLRLIERAGLIQRKKNGKDRREQEVYLTQKGRRLQRKVFASHLPLVGRLADPFSDSELETVRRWLSRVIAEMQLPETAPPLSKRKRC